MRTDKLTLAFAYLRLSNEEKNGGESSSISNQRMLIEQYCSRNNIILVREFVDDGWSGGNFDRPDFKEMIRQLADGKANMVITKDLSRLGRDMRESSYYAEQYFPEHGIHYIAINDSFDTEYDNIMAPFQFAMNEVYLRDGSRKVKEVLKSKREDGQYCACPPYGYKKDPKDKHRLVPDEMTAPVVLRIFQAAANGDSSRKIAFDLNDDQVIPPLKYRVNYRDDFTEAGAARASDLWNNTTVKRILKNQVYLGHTLLGKSKKVSLKSKKKVSVPCEDWVITRNTHPPIVTESIFDMAQANLGRGTRDYRAYDHVRKSIFSGIAFCSRCGHSLCSCGTVYKGEREKYWYLACTHQRKDVATPCGGVRVRYTDLLEVVRQDLNKLLSMDDDTIKELVENALAQFSKDERAENRQQTVEKIQARLRTIDRMVAKLYADNAEGHLDDDRLRRLVSELEDEAKMLNLQHIELAAPSRATEVRRNFSDFFALARGYTHIDTLDRQTLLTFIERIEVGPKEFPAHIVKPTHRNTPFSQSIRIVYKFIGEVSTDNLRHFPESVAM